MRKIKKTYKHNRTQNSTMAETRQRNYKTNSIRKQISKRNGKEIFNRRIRSISSCMGTREIPLLLIRKEGSLKHGSPSTEAINKTKPV